MNAMLIDLSNINLTRKEAYALALLLNRLTWSQLRACAVDEEHKLIGNQFEQRLRWPRKGESQDETSNLSYS